MITAPVSGWSREGVFQMVLTRFQVSAALVICLSGALASAAASASGGSNACASSPSLDGAVDASHPSGEAPPRCNPPGYRLAYSDDFSGSSLDPRSWETPGGFQYHSSFVNANHVTVHDGVLELRESEEAGVPTVGWAQLSRDASALLTYGKYLVRMKADAAPSVSVAALLWPNLAGVWPPEIDFAEDDAGMRHWFAFDQYSGTAGSVEHTVSDSGQSSSDWHTWGVEWKPAQPSSTRVTESPGARKALLSRSPMSGCSWRSSRGASNRLLPARAPAG